MISDEKRELLERANIKLGISPADKRGIVFVYCPPKVGSTSLVSYIRLFANHKYIVLHVHDEMMLMVLSRVSGVTVNEIINYNSQIGRTMIIIDIYREPIERKMSHFFEELSSLHFNNSEENLNTYRVGKVIDRFNKVFPYIGTGDHFLDEYDLHEDDIPEFNFVNKVIVVEKNGVKYIKLRLKDSLNWGRILSGILKTEIIIRADHETAKKPLGDLYAKFKAQYVIPENLLELVLIEKSFNKFNSKEEQESYITKWRNRQTTSCKHYSQNEYELYKEVSKENTVHSCIKYENYKDNGCECARCDQSRKKSRAEVRAGEETHRIVHARIEQMRARRERRFVWS